MIASKEPQVLIKATTARTHIYNYYQLQYLSIRTFTIQNSRDLFGIIISAIQLLNQPVFFDKSELDWTKLNTLSHFFRSLASHVSAKTDRFATFRLL